MSHQHIVNPLGDRPTLEVVCLHQEDAEAAVAGGADRLLVVSSPDEGGLSPEPAVVSAVCRVSEVPVRVMLRLNGGLSTNGGEFSRLVGLALDYLDLGASSFSFGFLDEALEIDESTTMELIGALPEVSWGFHRGFDSALSLEHAWRSVRDLPGLDAVATGGSMRGLGVGCDDLIERATRDSIVADLALATGGLSAETVPWLLQAGIGQFGLGASARPGRSWHRGFVDEGTVRSWRTLLTDTAARMSRRLRD